MWRDEFTIAPKALPWANAWLAAKTWLIFFHFDGKQQYAVRSLFASIAAASLPQEVATAWASGSQHQEVHLPHRCVWDFGRFPNRGSFAQ